MKFEKFLERNNLIVLKCLYKNENKKQYSYLLRSSEGKLYFCKRKEKLCEKDIVLLKNEIDFFNKFSNQNFSPKMIANYENEIILYQYINSVSLKMYLDSINIKKNDAILNEFKTIFSNLISVLKSINDFTPMSHLREKTYKKKIILHWFNLINSGPLGSQTRKLEKPIKKIISMLFKPSFKIVPNKKIQINGRLGNTCGGITHGDLHLNNIIISRDKKEIKIVDWERWEDSFFFTDLIYISSIFLIYFEGYNNYQAYIKKLLYKWIHKDYPMYFESYFEILNYYYKFGKINRNFYKNSKNCRLLRFIIESFSHFILRRRKIL
jgi:hypothetical protein